MHCLQGGKGGALRRRYTVRVLVPCCHACLDTVQRTVLAARCADRPAGTTVKVYICDDGCSARKRAWVAHLNDPDVIYLSGQRKIVPGQAGRSAAVARCVQMLYPDIEDSEVPGQAMRAPVEELLCVFDAGQMCSLKFHEVRI